MLVENPDYLELNPIGIELKYLKGIQKGKPFAEGFHQLMFKYRNRRYNGKKMKTYCIGVYNSPDIRGAKSNSKTLIDAGIFIGGFLNYYGIGFLDLNRDDVRIEWCSSRMWCKLDIGSKEHGQKHVKKETNSQKIIQKTDEGSKKLKDFI